jgi:peptidase E
MHARDDPIHDFILGLAGAAMPRVLFLGTASGDSESEVVAFYAAYDSGRCRPAHLALFDRKVADVEAFILSHDVIWVGGGNTANMLAVWRLHGLDVALGEAWESGKVLAGGSAGGLCWFEGGITDSFGPLQPMRDGLGLLAGSFCPHTDTQPGRRPLFTEAVLSGALPDGYTADDFAALHFSGTTLVEAISSRQGSRVTRVRREGADVVEEPLPTRVLEQRRD